MSLDSFISENNILPGDIFLFDATPAVHLYERFIAAVELLLGKGKETKAYYHVAMYVGNTNIVEAVWPKVHEVPIYFTKDFDVYRLKEYNADIANQAVKNAIKKVGEHYAVGYFFTLGLWKEKNEEICSRLVWDSYNEANKKLTLPDYNFITPEVLAASPDLTLHCKYRVNNG